MTCQTAQNQIQDLLDSGLTARENRRVQGHLKTCADCTRYERSLREVMKSLRALSVEEVSPNFNQKVLARLDLSRAKAPLPPVTAWALGLILFSASTWMAWLGSALASHLSFVNLVDLWEWGFHPSRWWPLLHLALAKGLLAAVHGLSIAKGLWILLESHVPLWQLGLQLGLSSLLAVPLVLLLSRKTGPNENRRFA